MIELMVQAEQALGLGLVDQAERLYQQVASADPHNTIAIVGLARVGLERGDQVGAHELALQALALDPENSAAIRMEARLREVLAEAGRSVAGPPAVTTAVRPGLVARLFRRAR